MDRGIHMTGLSADLIGSAADLINPIQQRGTAFKASF